MDHEQIQPEAAQAPASPHSNRKWIVLAVGAGCALLACAALVVTLVVAVVLPAREKTLAAATPLPAAAATVGGPAVQQSGNTMGNPYAPVKLIEYADFQCPFCRLYWRDTEQQIIDNYVKSGKVYYEYRSVGAYLGEESGAAAEAAYCAGDQGKFWEYHDTLYSHWTGENVGDFTREKLLQYAASIGLDQVAFEQCLSSGKQMERVQQDQQNARNDGIKGTPSFIINGKTIEGAQPYSVFEQVINEALQGQ